MTSSQRPRSRPSDKVAPQHNPSANSRKSENQSTKLVDTREKEIEKAVVAEDPDEDYEADNYEDDNESEKEAPEKPRNLTRTNDNAQIKEDEDSDEDEEPSRHLKKTSNHKQFEEDSENREDEYNQGDDDGDKINIDEN